MLDADAETQAYVVKKRDADRMVPFHMMQEDLKVEYYLCQLYHIDQEAKRKRTEMADQVAEVRHLEAAHAAAEAKVHMCF